MKIALLTTSATQGGAAIASARLADALTARGHEVILFTLPEGNRHRLPSFLMERAEIFLANGLNRRDLFKVSTGRFGLRGIADQVLACKPDAIIIGWVNQGLLSLRQAGRLAASGIPVAWVMHDLWNITGICHHPLGCRRYTARCGKCPFIQPPMRRTNDLSHRVWTQKKRLYAPGKIRFVAVSRWLAEQARRSSLMRDCPPAVIPNVFPLEQFQPGEKDPGLIVMGAARLDDPIKGLHYAVSALNRLAGHPTAHALFFGQLRDPAVLSGLKIPFSHVAELTPEQVAALMSRAEVVLSSSLYETFGLTLLEGQAAGCAPVSFDRGGQSDIIDHLHSGFLAPFGNVEALSRGIEWALEGHITPRTLRAEVERKFSSNAVARQYEALLAK